MNILRRLDNIMKVYNFDGGILHESIKKSIIDDDLDSCSIVENFGIDTDLKYILNMFIEDVKQGNSMT